MKECRNCKALLPLSEFYKHAQMGDGHLNKCKTCVKNRVNNHRAKNIEKAREYDRQRADLPHRVEARKEYQKTDAYQGKRLENNRAYKSKYPEKARARSAVNNAIRDGRLIKQTCAVCETPEAEAHHEDYSKPLDVIWFCDYHHKQRHRHLNKAKRENSLADPVELFIQEFKSMQDYQIRVVQEKEELDSKIEKLKTFLDSATSTAVSQEEVVRLKAQVKAMSEYSNILEERIANF